MAQVQLLFRSRDADVKQADFLVAFFGAFIRSALGVNPSSHPAINTTSNSAPFEACKVINLTASARSFLDSSSSSSNISLPCVASEEESKETPSKKPLKSPWDFYS